ncbi:FAD-dependent oxidoreductase, partial [Vibrio cholerae O1 biovar El Tor]|nr:FAD-dependent oxidoreductase [Vibrio cholerae O1 biovar El Tor]
VTLFEADPRLGGHAHTHDVDVGGKTIAVDSGFIVHNRRTYPTLIRLFDELGVATIDSEMSLSIRDDELGVEYCGGTGVAGMLPNRAALRPR